MNFLEIQKSVEHKKIGIPENFPVSFEPGRCITVCVVTGGDGMIRILKKETECHKGDLYILGEGISCDFFAKSDEEYPTVCTIRFRAEEWLPVEFGNPGSNSFCYGIFRDNSRISYAMLNAKTLESVDEFCTTALDEINTKKLGWESALNCSVNMLLITLARYIDLADTVKPVNLNGWTLVSQAVHEILERYGDCNMTLESIADTLFVSKSHLSRRFRQVTGESFSDYVKNTRINKACELLRYTGLTNEKIVSTCGFKDIPSFYRLFKENMGMTPYQYRMSQSTYTKSNKGVEIMSIINDISENLQKGKSKVVKELVENAIADGIPAAQILNEGLLGGMGIIGEKFKNNEVYVPEVLVAARAMNAGMQILKPLLKDDGVEATGKVCIGTVRGDLHDIGKNLVKMMMEGKGLEVIDLGTDVAPETFVEAAVNEKCSVICCSALLTTTMGVIEDVVKAVQAAGIRDSVKILIGGAPVTQEFCDRIGADRYTSDAASAADAAVELCNA